MLKFYAQWQHYQLQHLCKHRIINQCKVTYQKWYTSRSYYIVSQQLKNQTKKSQQLYLIRQTKLNWHLKTFISLVPWRRHSEDSGLSMMIGVKEAMCMWLRKKFLWGRCTHSNVRILRVRRKETIFRMILNPETFVFLFAYALCTSSIIIEKNIYYFLFNPAIFINNNSISIKAGYVEKALFGHWDDKQQIII